MKSKPISPKLAKVEVPEGATAAETLAIYEKEGVIDDLSDDQYHELAVTANKEEGISTGSTANGNSNRVGRVTVNGESFGNGGFDISRKGLKELYQGGMLDTVGNVAGGMYDSEIRDIMGRDDFGSFSRELNYELDNAFGLNELSQAMGLAQISGISGVFYHGVKAGINAVSPELQAVYNRTKETLQRQNVRASLAFKIEKAQSLAVAKRHPWSNFVTNGVSSDQAIDYLKTADGKKLFQQLVQGGHEHPYQKAMEVLTSGGKLPVVQRINGGDNLIKITADGVGASSPYFTTPGELIKAKASGQTLADYFGLPLANESTTYKVFQVTPKNSGGAEVFVSPVAPATDGLVNRIGGGMQYIVPNRSIFTDPVLIKEILLGN